MVENLPASAGDMGSSPGLGRSHMPQSNWAREPRLLSLRVWSLCSATREAAIVRGPRAAMKSGPHLPQLEKALAQKRRPKTAINKLKKKKISPLTFSSSLCMKVTLFRIYFPSYFKNEIPPSPQDSSSHRGKKSVMDKGNVSSTPPPYFSSWEGKEREIKFNEHFYYVPGALHMLFQFNPRNNPRRYF